MSAEPAPGLAMLVIIERAHRIGSATAWRHGIESAVIGPVRICGLVQVMAEPGTRGRFGQSEANNVRARRGVRYWSAVNRYVPVWRPSACVAVPYPALIKPPKVSNSEPNLVAVGLRNGCTNGRPPNHTRCIAANTPRPPQNVVTQVICQSRAFPVVGW